MNLPHVTVGLPVRNDPDGLICSVPTVFGQTWTGQIRLLVVDDGSTTDTKDVLKDLSVRYADMEIIHHKECLGRPSARNTILEHAGDGYLAWIDAGDLWHPRKLEIQLRALADAESRSEDPVICVGPFRWTSVDRGDERIRVPEVNGDQLYASLKGRIFPYLQGIVGRAEHFKRLGGFDPRLSRRQDYDMLVRFVEAGGHVVSSSSDIPVFTYLKSHVGASPEAVAESNRVLREKHREYYRRYGRRFTRELRHNQHRQVATFYRCNQGRARSLAHGLLGAATSPVIAGRRLIKRAWRPRRALTAVIRLPLRTIRPALPMLQRTEVMELARKFGAFKLISMAGIERRMVVNLRAEVEDASGSSPVPPLRGGQLPTEAKQLEAEVSESTAPVPEEKWLNLELIYRNSSLLHSAESALRRGLDQHPASLALSVRLVELLGLRRRSAACIEAWESCGDAESVPTRGLTHARVARAYRELGWYENALAIAETAALRWPDDFRVADELYISRAAMVDWESALAPVGADEHLADRTLGYVTTPGFLIGADEPLTGQVAAHRAGTLSLIVNGASVASTKAASGEADAHWARFSLSAHELLRYVGDGDVIWVESAGARLAVDGDAPAWQVTTGYSSRVDELRRELASGHVFTKLGTLRMGNTRERRDHTLALFDEVSARIEQSHGYVSYPFYGQLLGAIREHDLIAHDAGGFDMGYVSQHSTSEGVRTEFMDILRMLVDRGYHLRLEPWSAYVRPVRTSRVFVDLNYGWFNNAGELNFSFGWRHDPVRDRQQFEQLRFGLIGDRLVPVPGNAEEVLFQLYGHSWAIPDQGFVVDAEIRRDERFILQIDEMEALERLDPDRVVAIFDHHPAAR